MAEILAQIGIVIAGLSLAVSLFALRYAHRIDVRQRSGDAPIVNVEIERRRQNDGWHTILIDAVNRTDAAWTIESVEIRPGRNRLWTKRLVGRPQDVSGASELERMETEARVGPVPLMMRLKPNGTVPVRYGARDEAHGFALFKLDKPRRNILIRLTLRSSEANARSLTIASRRSTKTLMSSEVQLSPNATK